MSKSSSTQAVQTMTAAPEKPGSAFFLWAGIVCAASGILLFNLSHDLTSLSVRYVAIAAGVIPPLMTVFLGHSIKEVDENWMKFAVFVVTIGAMAVSASAVGPELKPAYGPAGSYVLPITLDGADLLLLYALINYYSKLRAYKQNLAIWNRQMAEGTAVAPAPAAPAPAPAAPAPAAPAPAPALAAPAPVQRPNRTAPAAGTGSGAPRPERAAAAKPATAAVPADAELRMKIAKEMRARARPAIEDTQQKIARLQKFVDEFHTRTGGARMNADEASIALRTHKSKIAALRACIREPGEPPAAGEQERGEETG